MSTDLGAAAKVDRRQRKSRAALDAALLQLIAERPYGDITVEDVVNAADVARATFYAHYRDKDDLLAAANQRLMAELMARVADVSWQRPPSYTGIGTMTILRHVETHRDLYRVVISGEGGRAARDVVINTFRKTAAAVFEPAVEQQHKTPRLPMRLITAGYVGAMLATIEDWLADDCAQDVEELAIAFMRGQVGGLEWSFGFEPGALSYTPESSG
jgi:AcrR family transcriptional regulator